MVKLSVKNENEIILINKEVKQTELGLGTKYELAEKITRAV